MVNLPSSINEDDLKQLIEDMLLAEFGGQINDWQTRCQIVVKLFDFIPTSDVYDFRVVCDQTNNPPEAIDHNMLRVDVFVKSPYVPQYGSSDAISDIDVMDDVAFFKALAQIAHERELNKEAASEFRKLFLQKLGENQNGIT